MAHIIIILPKVRMILHLKYKVQHARENSLLASAKQKALVTRLVKEGPRKMDLAIRDGAYDVGMIQEANITVSRAPTIIFGMDVSHGSHGRSDVPSLRCSLTDKAQNLLCLQLAEELGLVVGDPGVEWFTAVEWSNGSQRGLAWI
ncbi:probable phospholipid-transporting ATPase 4 [Tanacetum coccineum]